MQTRKARLRDFERRKAYAPEDVVQVDGTPWEYIPVHPLADDDETLARLAMRPEECVNVDLYWRREADVVFVRISTVGQCEGEAWFNGPGLYPRWGEEREPRLDVAAVTEADRITSITVEKILREAARIVRRD